MSRIALMLLMVRLLCSRAEEEAAIESGTDDAFDSGEQMREYEIEDLIKSLESCINAKESTTVAGEEERKKESNHRDSRGTIVGRSAQRKQPPQCDISGLFQGQTNDAPKVNPNPRDRKSIRAGKSMEWRRSGYDNNDEVDQLIKEAYGLSSDGSDANPVQRNRLVDLERDEQYRRGLLRMLNAYRLYNKRYQEEDLRDIERSYGNKRYREDDARTDPESRYSRLPAEFLLGRKPDALDAEKVRDLDRSRLLADRIAESALLMGYKKGRILDPLPLADEQAKRDVEVAATGSVAGATSVDASIGTGVVGRAGGTKVDTVAAATTSVDAAAGVTGGIRVEGGTSVSAAVGAQTNLGLGLVGQLNSCQDFERKMIMDMAIEEATAMIRKLAYSTRSGLACKNDPEMERRILSLAIELVNKVTLGSNLNGANKLDLMSGYRYNGVEDYLKSTSVLDTGMQADLLANVGLDYARARDMLNGGLYDNVELYDDYLAQVDPYSLGRCDSCSKYDLRMGNVCPVCKRSGNASSQARAKRKSSGSSSSSSSSPSSSPSSSSSSYANEAADEGKIYDLNYLPEVQKKVNIM